MAPTSGSKPIRMDGIDVYYGEILSEHAHHALETEHLSHLLCATDNDYYNALTCKAQGAEFGHHRTFQLATHLEAGGGNKRLPLQQRGYSCLQPVSHLRATAPLAAGGLVHADQQAHGDFQLQKQLQQRLGTQGEQWLLIGGISPWATCGWPPASKPSGPWRAG